MGLLMRRHLDDGEDTTPQADTTEAKPARKTARKG